MNLLLGKFNEINNLELIDIIKIYQEYFIFENKENNIYLYLDTKILKKYLKNGLEIKYRKYIFNFFKNNYIIKNNISYKLLDNHNILINKNKYIDNNLLKDNDLINLERIINLSNKILKNKNKFKLRNKNILKLNTNFYTNIKLERFYFSKIKYDTFKFNGIIINYDDINKNRQLSLLSIDYINKNNKGNLKINNLQLNTKCNLILTDINNINIWKYLINNNISNQNIYIIDTIKKFKNIINDEIFNLDFLIINFKLISNNFYKKYLNKYFNNDINNLNNLYLSIMNSIHDNLYNTNLKNEILNNLYIFNWNNIIYDNIELIKNFDKNNYVFYLTSHNTKYYLLNTYLDNITIDYIIKNNIENIDNNNPINIDLDNFYYFIRYELLIKNINKNFSIQYNFIKLNMTENQEKIYNTIFYEKINNNDEISNFFMNINKYNFNSYNIDKILDLNEKYYNTFCDNNIYKSKVEYFKNIFLDFNNTEYNCSMCIDKINKKDFCIINCGHYFCIDCLRKFIHEKKDYYHCPICREKFLINDIYNYPNNENKIEDQTKITEIIKLINKNTNKKIILVTQFKENILNIKNKLNIDIITYNLFFKNNNLKEKNKNLFNIDKKKCIMFTDFNEILNHEFNKIDTIIFIDYPNINYLSDNIFTKIKKYFLENYSFMNNIVFHFLYIKDTFEEAIINKYINI